MKFFIDTAEISEIKAAHQLGLVDGVTTNPSLVAKSGRDFTAVLKDIIALVDGPISAEVVATDCAGMLREAEQLIHLAPEKIVIKVPLTEEGLKATRVFTEQGVRTNVTLIFSPLQALLAAKAGASYVSPFVGRLDDVGHDGMEGVEQIRTLFDNYGYTTEIIVASVRSPQHVLRAGLMGADICTIPYSVLLQLMKHPLTDIGLDKFLADWQKHQQQ
ncbi:MAG: fructose-6-phosphate aldolase [Desulfuromonadales bacterium]|nr:fructose-6-phosphate aldolase [Desulfuromonadales bacterium]